MNPNGEYFREVSLLGIKKQLVLNLVFDIDSGQHGALVGQSPRFNSWVMQSGTLCVS